MPTLVVLAILVVLVIVLAQIWTEVLWFRQLGYLQVFGTEWGSRIVLFLIGAVVMAAGVGSSMSVAYRSRPIYAPSTPQQATLDQYREAIEPLRRVVMIVGPLVVGVFAGLAAAQRWESMQLWLHGQPFGQTDPQFGMDLGFYVFTLPAVQFIVSFLLSVAIIAAVAGVATHYLYGGIRTTPGTRGVQTTATARRQLSITGAALMVIIAANYWLDRYELLTRAGDKFEGASYTDVHAVIPSKTILAGVALFVAVLFIVTAVRGNWRLPAIGVGLMIVSAIIIGGIYPAIVQRFQVVPNQLDKEAPYIERNIGATRTAFAIDDVQTSQYNATVTAEPGALRADADTTASIRLLDPQVVSPSFRQLQQVRSYYYFQQTLSVDRYEIGGQNRDTVIAVRELDLAGIPAQRNWVNEHTVFTHGYGVVAAFGNTTASGGQPAFWESDIPSQGAMGPYEPRIYFSPNAPDYSIVGAPEGSPQWELDYPNDAANGQVNTTFPTGQVSAGPAIGDPFTKLLYAIKFGSEQIVFSNRVTADSQVLYDRDPTARVQKVAPYLTLDGRVYPAVVDGRVKWIVDGYTTTDQYPYSASRALDEATQDALTATSSSVQALQPAQVNYIRNSVKATVDAYDGSVDLYAWDTNDPVLAAWSKVFPTSLKPISDISGPLMSHIRYPEDMFKVQRDLLSQYHVTDAREFFQGGDFWSVPNDPTVTQQQVAQPPYYLTLQMPDQQAAAFSLTSTFIPAGTNPRNLLTGYLAADAEAGNTPGQPAEGYGTLRLLEMPRDSPVPGPGQVNNSFASDADVSGFLNVLELQNSTVVRGNLLTLPMGGGLLYVQPVYVQSSSGTQFPLLQRVLVAFGDKIGFAPTLNEALDQVFGGNSGARAGDAGASPTTPGAGGSATPAPSPSASPSPSPSASAAPSPEPTGSADARQRLTAALTDANQAMQDGQAALQKGDFAAYGAAQQRLQAAIEAAIAAEQAIG